MHEWALRRLALLCVASWSLLTDSSWWSPRSGPRQKQDAAQLLFCSPTDPSIFRLAFPCLCNDTLASLALLFALLLASMCCCVLFSCVFRPAPTLRMFCDAQVRKVVETVLTFEPRDSQEWRNCAAAFVDVSVPVLLRIRRN